MKMTNFETLIEKARTGIVKKVAVAVAQDEPVLEAIAEAKKLGIADAVLVGDREKIEEIAAKLDMDLSQFEIIEEKKFHKIKVEVILRELTKRGLVIEDKILLKDSNNNSILEEIVYTKKIY